MFDTTSLYSTANSVPLISCNSLFSIIVYCSFSLLTKYSFAFISARIILKNTNSNNKKYKFPHQHDSFSSLKNSRQKQPQVYFAVVST